MSFKIPDTCKCELALADDKEETVLEQIIGHDGKVFKTKPCELHKDIPLKDLFNVVLEENRRKNYSTVLAFKKLNEKEGVVSNQDGVIDAKNYSRIRWRFDENRRLKVGLPLALQPEIATLQTEFSKPSNYIDKADVQVDTTKIDIE